MNIKCSLPKWRNDNLLFIIATAATLIHKYIVYVHMHIYNWMHPIRKKKQHTHMCFHFCPPLMKAGEPTVFERRSLFICLHSSKADITFALRFIKCDVSPDFLILNDSICPRVVFNMSDTSLSYPSMLPISLIWESKPVLSFVFTAANTRRRGGGIEELWKSSGTFCSQRYISAKSLENFKHNLYLKLQHYKRMQVCM